MNHRNGYMDMEQGYGGRGPGYEGGTGRRHRLLAPTESNYEGDWGSARGGAYGYPEQRGRMRDEDGWGERHASQGGGWGDPWGEYGGMTQGRRSFGDTRPPGFWVEAQGGRGGRGYPDQGYGGHEYAGQGYGGGQGYPDQGYGGGQGYPGQGYEGYGDTYGRGYRSQGYGGQRQGGQGHYGRQGRGGQDYGEQAAQRPFRQQEGYWGKGPKGYRRSDERLAEDVNERLMEDDGIDATEISVECRQGIVTLSGSVPERRMKHWAEDLVDRCHGVQDIENRLQVSRGEEGRGQSIRNESGSTGAAGKSEKKK